MVCQNVQKLLQKAYSFTGAATATTAVPTLTMPAGRGDVRALELFANNNTLSDLAQANVSMSVNGISILENISLLKFSASYAEQAREIPAFIKETSEVDIKIVNGSANPIVISVNFIYV